MKAGQIARIRVNPQDCQSVLDILERVGINTRTLSFSQCVSIALTSLMETARAQKLIPIPDPFQYLNRMEGFVGQGNQTAKVRREASNVIGNLGEKFQAPGLRQPIAERQHPSYNQQQEDYPRHDPLQHAVAQQREEELSRPAATISQVKELTMEQRQAATRLKELMAKQELSQTSSSGVVWSTNDELEFQEVYHIVYPEG